MSRGKKLLILVLVLALAVGGYFGVNALVKSQEEQEAAEEAAGAAAEALAVADYDSITRLNWTYLEKSVTLMPDENGVWYCPDELNCPIDQSIVEEMLLAVSAVTGEKCLEQAEDLEAYGLLEPELVVTVTAGDVSRSYAVGDYSSAAEAYYMTVDGGNDIYLEDGSLEECFWYDLENLVDIESAPEVSQYLAMKVTTPKSVTELLYTEDPLSISYTDAFNWFLLSGGAYTALDTEAAESLCAIAGDIEWQRCVSWDADAAARNEYGFDEPQATVELSYLDADGSEQSYTIQFGDYCDSDTVYVLQEDSGLIFTCYGTVLDSLKTPDADSMIPETPLSLSGAEIKTLTLTQNGGSAVLDTADENVTAFLEDMTSLTVTEASSDEAGEELFGVQLTFAAGVVESLEIHFYAFDSLDCIASVNGQQLLVSRTSAEALAETAASFFETK